MNENYVSELKKIGLNVSEEIILKVIIPFLEEKIKDSESPIDDLIFASVKPALLDLIDKLDGEKN